MFNMDLLTLDTALTPIPLEDGALAFLEQIPLGLDNAQVFTELVAQTAWRAETVTVWGKRHLQPRLTAWHGEASYSYSGITLAPLPLTPLMQQIRQVVEVLCGHRFNSVLLNYYRDGRDSMGMHADNEAELGERPVIASLSFGATRTMIFKHKRTRALRKIKLTNGNLLIMSEETQKNWLHGIAKEAGTLDARLNLTFRKIIK
jgi:alkylated DNA repair dioxygenase AlkB